MTQIMAALLRLLVDRGRGRSRPKSSRNYGGGEKGANLWRRSRDGIFKEGYFVIVSRSAYPSPTFSFSPSGHVGGMHDNPLLAGVARKGEHGHGHASNRASLSASVASAVVLLLSHCAAGLFRLDL